MNNLARKLTSRKFWIAIIGVAIGLATAFGVDESEYAPVVGAVCSIASCIAYIMGEAKIDAASAAPQDATYNIEAPEIFGEEVTDTEEPLIGTLDPDLGNDEQ